MIGSLGRVEVFGRVRVLRAVATADVAARQALTQVDPGVAHLEALDAAFAARMHSLDFLRVNARHGSSPRRSPYHKHADSATLDSFFGAAAVADRSLSVPADRARVREAGVAGAAFDDGEAVVSRVAVAVRRRAADRHPRRRGARARLRLAAHHGRDGAVHPRRRQLSGDARDRRLRRPSAPARAGSGARSPAWRSSPAPS